MENQYEPKENAVQEDKLDDLYSMEGYDKPVRNARIILFVIAALQLLPIFAWTNLAEPARTINIAVNVFEALFFCGLAIWTKRKPYYAIIGGIIVYSLLIALYAVISPASILQGLIVKIIVYVLLIVGISNAKDVQRWKDSMKDE